MEGLSRVSGAVPVVGQMSSSGGAIGALKERAKTRKAFMQRSPPKSGPKLDHSGSGGDIGKGLNNGGGGGDDGGDDDDYFGGMGEGDDGGDDGRFFRQALP